MSILFFIPSLYYVSSDKIIQYFKNSDNLKVERMNPEKNFLYRISNFFTEPSLIIENIYLGNAFNACNLNQLEERNIKTIANISTELSNYYENYEEYFYFNIFVKDINEDSIQKYLESFFGFYG